MKQEIEEAVNNNVGVKFTSEDDAILAVASSIVSNNHLLSKIRGEAIDDAEKNGQTLNHVLENSLIGQRVGFMACVLFDGIRSGMITFKYVTQMTDDQLSTVAGETPPPPLRAVESPDT